MTIRIGPHRAILLPRPLLKLNGICGLILAIPKFPFFYIDAQSPIGSSTIAIQPKDGIVVHSYKASSTLEALVYHAPAVAPLCLSLIRPFTSKCLPGLECIYTYIPASCYKVGSS